MFLAPFGGPEVGNAVSTELCSKRDYKSAEGPSEAKSLFGFDLLLSSFLHSMVFLPLKQTTDTRDPFTQSQSKGWEHLSSKTSNKTEEVTCPLKTRGTQLHTWGEGVLWGETKNFVSHQVLLEFLFSLVTVRTNLIKTSNHIAFLYRCHSSPELNRKNQCFA